MCGRYTLRSSPQQLMSLFGVASLPEIGPRYNIAPTQQVLAFRAVDSSRRAVAGEARDSADAVPGGVRRPALLRWGLVPRWAKDLSVGSQMINARSETAAEKPSFRSAFVSRRCLIPADGFYEWEKLADGRKQPWWIHPPGGPVFAMAGLWESWSPPGGSEVIETCTILTTVAGPDVAGLHDRMPVILAAADWDLWLSAAASKAQLQGLLQPLPSGSLQLTRVSMLVNRATVDTPDCLRPDRDLFGDQR